MGKDLKQFKNGSESEYKQLSKTQKNLESQFTKVVTKLEAKGNTEDKKTEKKKAKALTYEKAISCSKVNTTKNQELIDLDKKLKALTGKVQAKSPIVARIMSEMSEPKPESYYEESIPTQVKRWSPKRLTFYTLCQKVLREIDWV